jgi:hypothetical protein
MKVTVAAFQNTYGQTIFVECQEDGTCWADEHKDYTRQTESAEIELPDLARDEIVAARMKTLDANEERIRDDFSRAIEYIKDERQKLMALPNHVSEQS